MNKPAWLSGSVAWLLIGLALVILGGAHLLGPSIRQIQPMTAAPTTVDTQPVAAAQYIAATVSTLTQTPRVMVPTSIPAPSVVGAMASGATPAGAQWHSQAPAHTAAAQRYSALADYWATRVNLPTLTATMIPSPAPSRTATATRTRVPTPVMVYLNDTETLWRYVRPTRTPIPTPKAVPAVLQGRIAFWSNLLGSTKRVLVCDPDGSNLALLLNSWTYEYQLEADRLGVAGRYSVFQAKGRHGLDLFIMPLEGGPNSQLTFVGRGKAYDPAWAPDGGRIVFASNQEGDDDIFAVEFGDPGSPHPRTIKLTQDDWESDKHPSYSPNGRQIVFGSNRSGSRQIWVMNADGTDLHQITFADAECWDPVWIK